MPPAAVTEEPTGLVYRPELVSAEQEAELLAYLDRLDFRELVMHGRPARRTVRHFGFDYEYASRGVRRGDPLPPELEDVRARCADLAGHASEELAQALITRYPAGAGIGWHRDAPQFGEKIAGLSLGSACRMRFQRGTAGERRVHELPLEPRSAYVMGGEARYAWQHSIPATKELRYSITFRTLRDPARDLHSAAGLFG